MAYFLGSDVKVALTTEHNTTGVLVASGATGLYTLSTTTSNPTIKKRGGTELSTSNAMADVVGLDLGIGAMDEDISYLGHRTPLKAEVHKETTVSLTLKRKNANFDIMYSGDSSGDIGRWGVNEAGSLADGLTEPDNFYGYRLAIHMKGGAECFTVCNACLVGHTVTLNADGTQEETIEFSSQVEPVIDNAAYTDPTGDALL
tara:strand:- start:35953 stop:36558 length:606 start_codon:yes stop_codon:yes gene_type:complete